MNERLNLGWGKTMKGPFGEFWNLTINIDELSRNHHVIKEHKGKKYLNLTMSKLSKPFEDGSDMGIAWNDFTPEKKEEVNENKSTNNVPF